MRLSGCIFLAGFALTGMLVSAAPSQAALRVCNQSFDVLNIAVGQPARDATEPDQFVTRGWWRVAPNQCATLLRESLQSRYFYVFAADVFGKEALSGSIPLCVAERRFIIDTQGNCLVRGYLDARFIEVDTKDQDDWTVFVSPRPG